MLPSPNLDEKMAQPHREALVREAEQRRLAYESLALCRQLEDSAGIACARRLLERARRWQGKLTEAGPLLKEAIVFVQVVNHQLERVSFLQQPTLPVRHQCQDTPEHTLQEETGALLRHLGNTRDLSATLLFLTEMLLDAESNLATARSLLAEGLKLVQAGDDQASMTYSCYLLGRMSLSQGETSTAGELFQESLRWACQAGSKVAMALALEGLADVAVAQQEPVWAARLWGAAEALREQAGAPGRPSQRADDERCVAAVHAQLGEQAFAAAWAQGRAMTPEQALAAQGLATLPMALSAGPPTTPPTRSATPYPDDLTAREVEVLRLVAQGLTDAQVAEQLVISPRTVNGHLRSIYSKIGVTSRSAATRYAVDHHLA